MIRNGILLLLIMLTAGCGYYSTTSRTAKDIKSVAVPFFDNRTAEPGLEITVTNLLIDDILQDNTLNVVDEDRADAILEGTITEFRNSPFSFNEDLDAEEYLIVITVMATLYNRKLNEPVWEKKSFKGVGSYFPETGQVGFTFEDAREQSVKEIAEQILNLTVQDW